MRISYVNGEFKPHRDCTVHIEDRGYQFGDGVYEVILVCNTIMIDWKGHLERLFRSLDCIELETDFRVEDLYATCNQLIEQNSLINGSIFVQITRGVAPRLHDFPARVQPVIVLTATPAKPAKAMPESVKVMTHRDIGWDYRNIKSVSLLSNVLMLQKAKRFGFQDTLFHDDDDYITESTKANAFIFIEDGILTHPVSNKILNGITRIAVLKLARAAGYKVSERRYTREEAYRAEGAFLTSSTRRVVPISQIDGHVLNEGVISDRVKRVKALYDEYVSKIAHSSAKFTIDDAIVSRSRSACYDPNRKVIEK